MLSEAGIEHADAFAAVSSGDNSNVIAARVARESFGVKRVAARIYDPRRAEVYQRLGIPTVATVRWTADQMLRRLLPEGSRAAVAGPDRRGGAGRGGLRRATGWARRPARWRRRPGSGSRSSSRLGEAVLPGPGTVLQEGDVLHVIALEEDLERISAALSAAGRPAAQAKGGR